MGNVIKKLFGGTTSKETSGPEDVTPPEIEELRGSFSNTLQALLGSKPGIDPIAGVPVQAVETAPVSSQEQTLLDLIGQNAQSGDRQNLISSTLRGEFLPGGQQANPFLQATIEAAQRPTLEGLQEVLGRTLPGKFALGGQQTKQREGSSAFDRAAAIATRGVSQSLADIATRISFSTQEAERARQQGAATIGQAEVQTGIEALQASALPRLIEQFGLDEGRREFKSRIEAVLKALQIATSTPLQTVAQASQRETDTDRGIIPGLFPSGLFGGAAGATAGAPGGGLFASGGIGVG